MLITYLINRSIFFILRIKNIFIIKISIKFMSTKHYNVDRMKSKIISTTFFPEKSTCTRLFFLNAQQLCLSASVKAYSSISDKFDKQENAFPLTITPVSF